jgi:hypothetical protein
MGSFVAMTYFREERARESKREQERNYGVHQSKFEAGS